MAQEILDVNYKKMIMDLGSSGLTPDDIQARILDNVERAATKASASNQGYVIPYYNIFGKPLTHYRCKLFDTNESEAKYRQPTKSSNHIYFPKCFIQAANSYRFHFDDGRKEKVVFITEGEKKAAIAVKLGFPCVALGGVDAWKNRVILLGNDPELTQKGSGDKAITKAKIDPGIETAEDVTSSLATGFQDLVDYIMAEDATVIIVFDSDKLSGVSPQVQRAAATLGFELRTKGVAFNKIRQMILPWHGETTDAAARMALDDFLVNDDNGYESFKWLVARCMEKRSAFPRHPSIVDYLNKRLQRPKLSRKESMHVALAILSELDSVGMRLRSNEEKCMYYFDFKTKTLMKSGFLYGQADIAHDTPFGGLLYRRYGISAADQKALVWLSAQFNGELPISDVVPERVIARSVKGENRVRYQINDGQYCSVDASGLSIDDNGANGVLFESGHVHAIDSQDLKREYGKRIREPLSNWWADVLLDTRIVDRDKALKLHALLYYISPWLYRWRGTQLPVELVLGESGSGKSTLSELRLSIITGDPRLRNSPQDIKDWNASVINSGALHVTDNVQLTDKSLRQRLSDELCRIITEPQPVIEMRKYFTNADLIRYPVRSVFAITAIQQPFQNADILQRSVILNLNKPADSTAEIHYDMDWAASKLKIKGGRVAWLSHHLYVLAKFFALVEKEWNPEYRAKHRLINLEQSLMLMARVFEPNEDPSWIPNYLMGITNNNITHADWTFEGIARYLDEFKGFGGDGYIMASNIAEWAESEEDFKDCDLLTNTRRLGRYMQNHKSMLASILGLIESGTTNNRARFKLMATRK